jgi:S-adenosylmethionine hydrolase
VPDGDGTHQPGRGAASWLTFLSDFGFEDPFLGVCKGVIARTAPDVRVLDVMHLVQPQDIEQGAAVLASAVPYLPSPAVHLALVDPFRADAGARRRRPHRRRLHLRLTGQRPDLAGLEGLRRPVVAHVLDDAALWAPAAARTFRGRDVFAPVAAALAGGTPIERVGTEVDVEELELLAVREPAVDDDHVHGEVVTVDHFGNLTLNLQRAHLERAGITLGDTVELRCSGKARTVPFLTTYGQADRGALVVCEDSFSTVTVAVNQGSAAADLRARRGDPVVIALPHGSASSS